MTSAKTEDVEARHVIIKDQQRKYDESLKNDQMKDRKKRREAELSKLREALRSEADDATNKEVSSGSRTKVSFSIRMPGGSFVQTVSNEALAMVRPSKYTCRTLSAYEILGTIHVQYACTYFI